MIQLTEEEYAERIAQARREGAAEALESAAAAADHFVPRTGVVARWLRSRAAALRGDA